MSINQYFLNRAQLHQIPGATFTIPPDNSNDLILQSDLIDGELGIANTTLQYRVSDTIYTVSIPTGTTLNDVDVTPPLSINRTNPLVPIIGFTGSTETIEEFELTGTTLHLGTSEADFYVNLSGLTYHPGTNISIDSGNTISVTGITSNVNQNLIYSGGTTIGISSGNTISLTNLPYLTGYTNTYTTGATYNNSTGVATFTRNDGNTYNLNGLYTGYTNTQVQGITGVTQGTNIVINNTNPLNPVISVSSGNTIPTGTTHQVLEMGTGSIPIFTTILKDTATGNPRFNLSNGQLGSNNGARADVIDLEQFTLKNGGLNVVTVNFGTNQLFSFDGTGISMDWKNRFISGTGGAQNFNYSAALIGSQVPTPNDIPVTKKFSLTSAQILGTNSTSGVTLVINNVANYYIEILSISSRYNYSGSTYTTSGTGEYFNIVNSNTNAVLGAFSTNVVANKTANAFVKGIIGNLDMTGTGIGTGGVANSNLKLLTGGVTFSGGNGTLDIWITYKLINIT